MKPRRRFLFGLLCGAIVVLMMPTVQAQTLAVQVAIAINQLVTGLTPFTQLQLAASSYANWGATSGTSGYGLRDNAGAIEVKNSGGAWTPVISGSGAPPAASYWTRVSEAGLTDETVMGALGTGVVINATTTGVPTIYAGSTCTNQFVRSLNASAAATCASVILSTDTTGTLGVTRGGTGLTSGTSGGVLAFSSTGTLVSSAALTNNVLVVGGGPGSAPSSLAAGAGTATTLLHGGGSGEPTWSAVVLTTDVSGILGSSNGGTGNAFFALSGPATSIKTYTLPNSSTTILTTASAITAAQGGTGQTSYAVGDLLYASGAAALSKLADVATGNALISGGVGVAPSWGKIGLTTHVSGTLGATNGGTGIASYTTGDLLYASSGTSFAARAAVAAGQVLASNGVGAAPVYTADPKVSTLLLDTTLALSGAAPTISSGFGTTPSIAGGRAAAFRLNVGTGGIATSGVVGLPTAATGWNCTVMNLTALAAHTADAHTVQTASSTTTVTLENQTVSSGAATAWGASNILAVSCIAF